MDVWDTKRYKIKNKDIRDKVGVSLVDDKMQEERLRWFGHVKRRCTNAPVWSLLLCSKLIEIEWFPIAAK
ncbi:hypothetical protein H5410_012989 [Solanum commersonii]|uniref:Uncharacterized protein n=1 Tax=Solanum commersonii TaxID=4109 RepID=A0A9J6AU17_SOLCO|nr:hypothetical protein H5410_012989 [Solanum commersonii]